jgi:DNA-binding IclR family transcriptional regulator
MRDLALAERYVTSLSVLEQHSAIYVSAFAEDAPASLMMDQYKSLNLLDI